MKGKTNIAYRDKYGKETLPSPTKITPQNSSHFSKSNSRAQIGFYISYYCQL